MRRLVCLAAVVLLFAAGPSFASREEKLAELLADENATSEQFIELGDDAFGSSNKPSEISLQAYSEATRRDPGNVRAWQSLVIILMWMDDWDNALQRIEEGQKATNGYVNGHWERAYALVQMGKLAEAKAALARAKELGASPGHVEVVAGLLAFADKDYPKAQEHWQRGLDLVPRHEGLFPDTACEGEDAAARWLAEGGRRAAAFAAGRYAEVAQMYLADKDQLFGMSATDLLWAYVCLRKVHGHDEAKAALEQAVDHDKLGAGTNVELLDLLLAGPDADVENFLERKARSRWGANGGYLAGFLALERGRPDLADLYFEHVLASKPILPGMDTALRTLARQQLEQLRAERDKATDKK